MLLKVILLAAECPLRVCSKQSSFGPLMRSGSAGRLFLPTSQEHSSCHAGCAALLILLPACSKISLTLLMSACAMHPQLAHQLHIKSSVVLQGDDSEVA